MKADFPIRVGLMDDDYFALKCNAGLISRDLRTVLSFETESPMDLLRELKHGRPVDVVVMDVEYGLAKPDLQELLCAIQDSPTGPAVICLSQYGGQKAIQIAIACGARGFLLKRDIRLEICSALAMVSKHNFLVSAGVATEMLQEPLDFVKVHSWLPHPGLSPQLRQVFTLKVLYGMSASLVANEIHLAVGSVEKYMQYVYQRLNADWGDHSSLADLDLQEFPPEIQAFHLYTLPPKQAG